MAVMMNSCHGPAHQMIGLTLNTHMVSEYIHAHTQKKELKWKQSDYSFIQILACNKITEVGSRIHVQ